MKYILLFFSVMLFSCASNEGETKKAGTIETPETSIEQPQNQVVLVDFHSTRRCATCNAIEDGAQYTLETYFKEEIKSKKLAFKIINVDDEKNSESSEKFGATGTSLYLDVFVEGHETIIDLTDMAFMKAKDKKAFSDILKEEISKQLRKL